MKKIVQKGSAVLKAQAMKVTDPHAKEVQKLIRDMFNTLAEQPDGVALAAPQVGESLRIFVVAEHAYQMAGKKTVGPLVFINPEIKKTSKKIVPMEEGCLSVRGVFGGVERFAQVTITATDERGEDFTYGASGLIAQIFQHEMDHLNGILFTEKILWKK